MQNNTTTQNTNNKTLLLMLFPTLKQHINNSAIQTEPQHHYISKQYIATYNNELVECIYIHPSEHVVVLLIATNHEDEDDTYSVNSLDELTGDLRVFEEIDNHNGTKMFLKLS
jgi:hypothetical protein